VLIGLRILIIVCSLIGIAVCAMGMKNNIFYKGGLYFFLLFFIESMYSLIVPGFISRLIEQRIDNPGHWVHILSIPPLIFTAAALVILLIYLCKGLNKNSNN